MSNKGYNETLAVPSNHKDSSGASLKAFDTHFRTLNNGLISVARNLGGIHAKVGELETATKSANDLKYRVDTMEKTLTAHGKLLSDIRSMLSDLSKAGQHAPVDNTPQAPPQFAGQVRTMPTTQKTRAQLMLEAQRKQAELKAKGQPVQQVQPTLPLTPQLTQPNSASVPVADVPETFQNPKKEENINRAVEDLLNSVTLEESKDTSDNKTLDQILEHAATFNAPEESDSDEEEPSKPTTTVPLVVTTQPEPKLEPKPEPTTETKEESESEESGNDDDDEDDSDNNEDLEISEDDEAGANTEPTAKPAVKPAGKPATTPAKPTAKNIVQAATPAPAAKPAAKPVLRRIVSQKKSNQ